MAGGTFGEWVALWSWIPSGLAIVLTFLLFPDGHSSRAGWLAVAWVNVVGVALLLPGWALTPDIGDHFVGGRNPYAVDGCADRRAGRRGHAAVPRLVRGRRSCRSSCACGAPPGSNGCSSDGSCSRPCAPRWSCRWSRCCGTWLPIVRPLTAVALTAMPVGACIAILRYRLYDIDIVISRTVAYGALTVLLAATYAVRGRASAPPWVAARRGPLPAPRWPSPPRSGPFATGSRTAVDRRFNRARFDALQQMTAFLDDLRAGRAVPEDVERGPP